MQVEFPMDMFWTVYILWHWLFFLNYFIIIIVYTCLETLIYTVLLLLYCNYII